MNFINKLIEVINTGENNFLNDMIELIEVYYKNSKSENNKSCGIGLDIYDSNVPSGNTGIGNKALLSVDKEIKIQKDDRIAILNEFRELSQRYDKKIIKTQKEDDNGGIQKNECQSKEGKIIIKKYHSKDEGSVLKQILEKASGEATPKDEKLYMDRSVPDTDYLITKILMTLGFENTIIDNIRIRQIVSQFISENNVSVNTRINHHELLFRCIDYLLKYTSDFRPYQDRKVILSQACMYGAILLHNNNKIVIETSTDSRETVTVMFGNMTLKYSNKDCSNFIKAMGTLDIYAYRYMEELIKEITLPIIQLDGDYWINSRNLMLNSSTIYDKLKELHDVFYKKDTLLVGDTKPILLTIYGDLITMISINKSIMDLNKDKIKEIAQYYGYQHRMDCPIFQAIINEFIVITNYKIGSVYAHIDVSELMTRLRLYNRLFQ